MDLDGIPLFALLKSRLSYLGERQKVIAANIANSDTPGYAPHDLKPFASDLAKAVGGGPGVTLAMARSEGTSAGTGLAVTSSAHMAPRRQTGKFKPVGKDDNEITLDGNGVVLEEQSMKLTEARMDYDAAIGFYQKSLGLLRMAAKAPGK
jgi:flagellar basal-body rod protein FlgB